VWFVSLRYSGSVGAGRGCTAPGSRPFPPVKEHPAWRGLPLRRFFNTSGLKYKSLALKDKLPTMTEDEQLHMLATDGMLVKRPLMVGDDFVLVGFKPDEWASTLK